MTEAGPLGADTYMVLLDPTGQEALATNDDIDYPNNPYSKITYKQKKQPSLFSCSLMNIENTVIICVL